MSNPIYLDYNGTTPHDPEVVEAMMPFLHTEFGNPSSSHWYGIKPKQAVAAARKQVAGLLGCSPEEIIFTSGGTEANNHAIFGVTRGRKTKGGHIITTAFEHPAVLEVCRYLENEGIETTYLPVDNQGMLEPASVAAAIRPDTILITVMHANNEVGTIQPIADIAAVARRHGISMHTDAAQSTGKVDVDVRGLGVDLLSVAGHKIYAPKGVGVLYVRKGVQLDKFCHGAGQESGWRAGTENVIEIVGLGKACEVAGRDLKKNIAHMHQMRDRLQRGIMMRLEDVRLNGHREHRLPNTLSLAFKGLAANRIIEEIGLEVAVSAGAACHSDTVTLSHVLTAMQVPPEWAMGTVRFSTGRFTTLPEIDQTVTVVEKSVRHLRSPQ
jgi:cysteine desulfurase